MGNNQKNCIEETKEYKHLQEVYFNHFNNVEIEGKKSQCNCEECLKEACSNKKGKIICECVRQKNKVCILNITENYFNQKDKILVVGLETIGDSFDDLIKYGQANNKKEKIEIFKNGFKQKYKDNFGEDIGDMYIKNIYCANNKLKYDNDIKKILKVIDNECDEYVYREDKDINFRIWTNEIGENYILPSDIDEKSHWYRTILTVLNFNNWKNNKWQNDLIKGQKNKGWSFKEPNYDFAFTNLFKCSFSTDGKWSGSGMVRPSIDKCIPLLLEEIKILKPTFILFQSKAYEDKIQCYLKDKYSWQEIDINNTQVEMYKFNDNGKGCYLIFSYHPCAYGSSISWEKTTKELKNCFDYYYSKEG